MNPEIPPGFEIEQTAPQASPQLPPGFEIEQQPSTWVDTAKDTGVGIANGATRSTVVHKRNCCVDLGN